MACEANFLVIGAALLLLFVLGLTVVLALGHGRRSDESEHVARQRMLLGYFIHGATMLRKTDNPEREWLICIKSTDFSLIAGLQAMGKANIKHGRWMGFDIVLWDVDCSRFELKSTADRLARARWPNNGADPLAVSH